ncbi:MAG TPA: DNA repair protein RecO [Candidatus Deferrimicrobium sp.]|nr:DNA repair protein RecO [Candidatus Deferrimicrobium sp.]
MAIEKTEAIILKSYNWSETSRLVEVFSRDFGKLVLVDKGGRRFKTKRGRLVPLARMDVTIYKTKKSPKAYLSETELVQSHTFEKEGTVGRLAFASAACELVRSLLSEDQPHASLYGLFADFLNLVDKVDKDKLPPLFLSFFLQLLSELGYQPSLEYCVGCRKTMTAGQAVKTDIQFAPAQGGLVCNACQSAGDYYIALSRDSFRQLLALQHCALSEAATVAIGYAEAMYLAQMLVKFTGYQTGVVSELKSLRFLAKLKAGVQMNTKVNGKT